MKRNLVEPLKREVYRAIHRFRRNAHLVLLDSLHDKQLLPPTRWDVSIQEAFQVFQASRQQFAEPESEQMEGLFRDCEYLQQMHVLEDEVLNRKSNNASTGKLSDIVPITGLIIGRLHRLENELKTVLQHWQGRMRK